MGLAPKSRPVLIASKSFQGLCLASVNGHQTMPDYDALCREARDALKDAPINLCPTCLGDVMVNNRVGYGEAVRLMVEMASASSPGERPPR